MKNNFKILLFTVQQLQFILNKSQKRQAFIVLIVIVVSAGFELLGVSAILPFVQAAIAPDELMNYDLIRTVDSYLHINNPQDWLVIIGVALIFIYILKNVFMLFASYVQSEFSTKVQRDLSVNMLQTYMERPYTFFLETNSAEIIRGCSNDVGQVFNIIECLMIIFSQMLSVIMIGIFLICTDYIIAFSVLLLMALVMLGIVIVYKPIINKLGKKNQDVLTLKTKTLYQAINGVKEIYVMNRKKKFVEEYEIASSKTQKVQSRYAVLSNSPDKIVEGICVSGIIGIVCIRLMSNDVNMAIFIPKLAAFAMAAFKILPSVGKITSRMTSIIYNRPGLNKVYQNMQDVKKYARIDKTCRGDKESVWDLRTKIEFKNKLTIKGVAWKYESQDVSVLTDVNLTIKKGEAIALIGASGAGKTTLSDAILGLLRPLKGTIQIDGVDIGTIGEMWAEVIGYVPQTIYLIDDTIRNNIAFGLPTEKIEDEKIWEALEKAQLKEFVKNLPFGLDTIVGERGIKFSGGQRQRIAIARALYNQPEILVLDEATASLDNETEKAVMDAINSLQGKVTLIIVAHRLSTIKNCDKIYEIKDGVAIERTKQDVFK